MRKNLLLIFACAALIPWQSSAGEAEKPPNVIVLIADDAGWRDFGAYGHPNIKTPSIDKLAQESWLADNAYLTSPQCSPSRISILSGQYPHQTGTEDLHVPTPHGAKLLPSYLSEAGYFTGIMRKQHLGEFGSRQFDWQGEDLSLARFLELADDKPFFLWVGFRDPHRDYGDAPKIHSADDIVLPKEHADSAVTRADHVQYYDEISRMDGAIGTMLEEVDELGLHDNTYVVFLSDNGAPMPRAKGTLYDAGIKTPLIVRGPGVAENVRYKSLVSVIDLAPTVLEWAGVEKPVQMIGNSIAAAMSDPETPGRSYAFSQRDWHNVDEHMRSIRAGRYKLIWNNYVEHPHGSPADVSGSPSWLELRRLRDTGQLNEIQGLLFTAPRPRVELYDLQKDPYEHQDLAADPANRKIVQRLMRELQFWRQATGDVSPHQRRRDDNTDRTSGVKFSTVKVPPFLDDND